jgi:CRP-like cAMP-binding protein
VTAPQVWGVASLVAPFAPTGTASTKTECRMLQLKATDVRQLAEQNPRLGSKIYLGLATHVFRRLRDLTHTAQRRPS